MKHSLLFALLAAFTLSACDQTKVKKEAYDKGFAEGREAVAAEARAKEATVRATTAARAAQGPRTALDQPVAATPRGQVPNIIPNSKLQGTALDRKPPKH